MGTRAMAEPVRDLSLGGAEGLGGSRVRALQGRDAPGEGWAEGTMSVEGSTLRVSQGHTCPLTSVPPAQPFCSFHPISQPPPSAPSAQLPPSSPSMAQPILLVTSHKHFIIYSTF